MDFNAFFQEYLNLRTKMFPKRSLKSLPWHLWLISGIALLLLLLGCIISFINHDGMMSLPFSFSALLLLVIYSKITTPRNPPKPRKDYTNAFCRLLQDYRISPNNVKAVERFIAYIEKTIKKDDPLEPFVKPFKSIYPLIITIISYCAGTLATSLSWRELLATSVLIIIIIILLAFFSTLIRPALCQGLRRTEQCK